MKKLLCLFGLIPSLAIAHTPHHTHSKIVPVLDQKTVSALIPLTNGPVINWQVVSAKIEKKHFNFDNFVNTIAYQEHNSLAFKGVSSNPHSGLVIFNNGLLQISNHQLQGLNPDVIKYFDKFSIQNTSSIPESSNNAPAVLNVSTIQGYVKEVTNKGTQTTLTPGFAKVGYDIGISSFPYDNKYIHTNVLLKYTDVQGTDIVNTVADSQNLQTVRAEKVSHQQLNATFNLPLNGTIVLYKNNTITFLQPELIK